MLGTPSRVRGRLRSNARTFTDSDQSHRWLVASAELTRQLLTVDVDQPLSMIVQHAADAAGADFATLQLRCGVEEVVVAAACGTLSADLVGLRAPLRDSPSGHAILFGEAALVADAREESTTLAWSVDTGPLIVVPLTAGERTCGALMLGRVADRPPFTEIDLSLAASFAHFAAVALELAESRDARLRLSRLEDHDRINGDLHDHVVHELFALGMGLQGLASITDQPAQLSRITSYVDRLDAVIGTIRTTIFHLQLVTGHDRLGLQWPGGSPHVRRAEPEPREGSAPPERGH